MMGMVRAVVWPGSESLMKGLRCALSSVESMVGSPVGCQKGQSQLEWKGAHRLTCEERRQTSLHLD
jgi:hypothetical protein